MVKFLALRIIQIMNGNNPYANVYFSPDPVLIGEAIERAVIDSIAPDLSVYTVLNELFNDFETTFIESIAYAANKAPATLANYEYLAATGTPVRVGKGGRKEKVSRSRMDRVAQRTGFLVDKLTIEKEEPYSLPPWEEQGGDYAYQFGVDENAFYNKYPLRLLEWLKDKIGSHLIHIDDHQADVLMGNLFDLMWDKMEANFSRFGFSRT